MAQKKNTLDFKSLLLEFVGTPDPLYELLKWITEKMMQIESEQKVGAKKGKHSNQRTTHFSGTRIRRFDTRLGTLYLVIPKLRKGGYIPFFVTEKKRSEQALIQVVQEAFINGVSTRKVERLAQRLGIENISASQVSEINKGLDEQVAEFKNKELEAEYPVLWIDALYEKIRDNNRVENTAVMVVCGLNKSGEREILAVEAMPCESEATYRDLFKSLKARGLKKTWLVISDAHQGLKNAIKKEFIGSSWQRCKVHFMKNVMARVGARHKSKIGARIKEIWNQPDMKSARTYALGVVEEFSDNFPEAMDILEDGLDDSLQFYSFSALDKRKLSSTNMIERVNKEIRRRTKVIGIFPSRESYLRLIICYLIEYTEDWSCGRCYIKQEKLEEQEQILLLAA